MDDKSVMAKGLCERIGQEGSLLKFTPNGGEKVEIKEYMPDHTKAIRMVLDALCNKKYGVIANLNEITAVGHRIVHGGEVFSKSVLITDEVKEQVKKCFDLAPLHNPANIIGIEACEEAIGKDIPQVGVFDTAFHQSMPEEAYTYAIKYEDIQEYNIRRYGAHGTSHRFVSKEMAKLLDKPVEDTKIITCHIGNGSSITAVKGGRCVDTSMGFTPLDGVEMGTRCGAIDPAIVPYIMKKKDYTPDQMSSYMNKECGFLGVSGISSDSRDIEAAILKGDRRAWLAANILAYQIKKYIGSYTAAMNGLDAIVFTAGMGENNPELRERVCTDMEYFGIEIDKEKNAKAHHQSDIVELSTKNSKVKVFLIPTNEELMIASDTEDIVKAL